MSAVKFSFTGFYRPCPKCSAPAVMPFPPDWRMNVLVERSRQPERVWLTPHLPDCKEDDE